MNLPVLPDLSIHWKNGTEEQGKHHCGDAIIHIGEEFPGKPQDKQPSTFLIELLEETGWKRATNEKKCERHSNLLQFMDLIHNPKSYKLVGGKVYDKQLGNVNLAKIFNDIKELFLVIFRHNICILIMLLNITYG